MKVYNIYYLVFSIDTTSAFYWIGVVIFGCIFKLTGATVRRHKDFFIFNLNSGIEGKHTKGNSNGTKYVRKPSRAHTVDTVGVEAIITHI